jgi:hypothetical protein
MSKIHAVKVVRDFLRKRAIPRGVSIPLVFLACFMLSSLPALSQGAPARGTIRLMIVSNLAADPPLDSITLTVAGSDDKTLLMDLALTMGKKFGSEPTFFAYERGDKPFSDGLALTFRLKVMPRDGHTLPTNELLEIFAPSASSLQVLYQIHGAFTYSGTWEMKNQDVTFKVTKITEQPNAVPPFALYDTEATITTSSVTSASIDDYLASKHKNGSPRRFVYLLFGLALVIGVSGGVLIAHLLKQWKTEHAARAATTPEGVKNERQRDDA